MVEPARRLEDRVIGLGDCTIIKVGDLAKVLIPNFNDGVVFHGTNSQGDHFVGHFNRGARRDFIDRLVSNMVENEIANGNPMPAEFSFAETFQDQKKGMQSLTLGYFPTLGIYVLNHY